MSGIKLLHGVASNDADYVVYIKENNKIKRCPYYASWIGMLERCYNPKYKQKAVTYAECITVPEWLSFMNFKRWMMSQDWEGKELDKDIIKIGNKVYGPDTCVFVSKRVNTLFGNKSSIKRPYPQGVYFNKVQKKYFSQITKNGNNIYLGCSDDVMELSKMYEKAKRLHILTIACCEPDVRVKQGLYRHSETYRH